MAFWSLLAFDDIGVLKEPKEQGLGNANNDRL